MAISPIIDANWKFDLGDGNRIEGYGEDPPDAIEIRWDSEDYNRMDNSAYYGEFTSNPSADKAVISKTNDGIVAEFEDQKATANITSSPPRIESYFGTGLDYESSAPPSDKGISIFYKHFYDDVSLDWSYTFGAPTVNPVVSTDGWAENLNSSQAGFLNGKTEDNTQ